MDKQKMLVTGAAGFAGSYLVRELVQQGYPVRAMVRDRSKADAIRDLPVELVEGDVRDQTSCDRACDGVSGVFHIAALYRQAGLPESVFDDVNVEGTKRMLDAAIKGGATRFVHCSTGGVLGDVKNPPGTEETPYNPGDMYQRSKVKGEIIALEYFRSGKIQGHVVRPAIIYGPGDTRTAKIFKMVARGKFFYVGAGDKNLHWIDVRDLARGFILAMEKTDLNGEVYMIPGQEPILLREMVKEICSVLGAKEPTLHLPVKPMQVLGDICEAICTPLGINPPLYRRRVDFYTKNRHFSGEKATRELGFKPAKSPREEIREIAVWYRDNGWY